MTKISDLEVKNVGKKEASDVSNSKNINNRNDDIHKFEDTKVNLKNKILVPIKKETQSQLQQNKEEQKQPINPSRLKYNKYNPRNRQNQEFEERVINISRITNVVKGGRRFSFSALVVIGDKKGRVAQGHGKAKEVPGAIKKAIKDARKHLITIPIVDKRTIPHIAQAKFVSSKVLLKPATKGRGIIASGAVRSVVELAGYHDIVTKSLGSSNKTNVVKATLKALKTLKIEKQILDLRSR